MTLSEPPRWEDGPLFLTLRKDDGSLSEAVEVTPGVGPNDVVLPDAPGFDIIVDHGDREPPQYLLGHPTTGREIAKVINRTAQRESDGTLWFDLDFIVDDDRVHTADSHLLPGPGDIQDPIDDGTDYPPEGGGGFATVARLSTHSVVGGGVEATSGAAEFTLGIDGRASADGEVSGAQTFPGEWLNTAPVDPSVSDDYEVLVHDLGFVAAAVAGGATFTGTLETWLPLSSDQSWEFAIADIPSYTGPVTINPSESTTSVLLSVSIRRSGVVLVTRQLLLQIIVGHGGGA